MASINTQDCDTLKWFAIYVQAKHEKIIATTLKSKGFDICLPLTKITRKWSDRRKEIDEPIFPGYVFCEFNSEFRTPVLRTGGVVQILGVGKQIVPLATSEVEALKTLERTKSPVEEWPYVEKGQWVCIEKGPLSGLTGRIAECKSGLRVVVSVGLLQRSVAVEVNRSQIRPTTAPATFASLVS